MLSASNRLRKKVEVERVLFKGKQAGNQFFFLRYYKQSVKSELSSARATVVVGKKFHNKAVKRNRIKRQVRHILRGIITQPKNSGIDFAVIVKKQAEGASYLELKKSLNGLFIYRK